MMVRAEGFEPSGATALNRGRMPIPPRSCVFLAGAAGFEPAIAWLRTRCLADLAMLPRLVDPPGIQPGPPACKAGMPRGNTSDP